MWNMMFEKMSIPSTTCSIFPTVLEKASFLPLILLKIFDFSPENLLMFGEGCEALVKNQRFLSIN